MLAVTGIVGIGLAVHGYGHGAVAGSSGLTALASTGGSSSTHRSSSASAPAAATTTTQASSSSTTQPAATTTTQSSSAATGQKVGPLLSSTSYAPYAFQVYPGPESSQARQATIGFKINVVPQAGMLKLSVAATGSGQGAQTSSFPVGDRIYFIEASLGDDSGLDYNFGDDGVVVTNAQGHVVQ